MDIIQILQAGVQMGASDIHITVGCPPMARVSGDIVPLTNYEVVTQEVAKTMIYSVLSEDRRARFESELELDTSFEIAKFARFRVNVLQQRGNTEAVFRIVRADIPSPEFLGLGPVAMSLADLPRGLVLVTGPTGHGKSTTLACMIEHINQKYCKNIITIEDPIEFVYEKKQSIIRQREVGPDTKSFQHALRHALRQNPDVILVGELRDLESIALALTAAETGHLCFATLHTTDAAQTVARIVDVFPAHQQEQVRVQVASSLQGVISQTLLPRANGRGQVAARELMLNTPAIANLIREGKDHMITNAMETGGKMGMYTLDKTLEELVRKGTVALKDALSKSSNPQRLATTFGTKLPTAGAAEF